MSNPDYMREWRAKNKDKCKEYLERRKKKPYYKKYKIRNHLKSKYGLTEDGLHALKEDQGHRCKICGQEKTGTWASGLVVDHCHESGVVRGLLCTACNVRLGWYERHALDIDCYLARWYKRSA